MCGSRGGIGGSDTLKNHKNIGSLSNPVKPPSQHSVMGDHRPASETPFKWRFAGGMIMTRL